jgi:hypothetical protein
MKVMSCSVSQMERKETYRQGVSISQRMRRRTQKGFFIRLKKVRVRIMIIPKANGK